MNIEKESKWVKDGQVYTVSKVEEVLNPRNDTEILVWFSGGMVEYYATTQPLFLEQYKPITLEYMYAFKDNHNICRVPTSDFYKDDEEFELYHPNRTEYQRLDFTKRERK